MNDSDILEYAAMQAPHCIEENYISDTLFREYGVYRGLRDENGKGVLNLKNRYKKLGVKNLSCKLYEG